MAKTKPTHKKKKQGKKALIETPEQLLTIAATLLQTSQAAEALPIAEKALSDLTKSSSSPTIASLPALSLIAEIYIELGDPETAREQFLLAATLDPDGDILDAAGGGAEKFLWLAQLCEDGGAESIGWFQKGAQVLRKQLAELEGKTGVEAQDLQEKKLKLANALCGIAEVYMTDLSWEEEAETRCEASITEALLVAPNSPEALQTLASIRISQSRLDDAKAALSRSMEIWKELSPEDPAVPDFSTRISLARLLMETEMEEDALEVLERLVIEDDSSVEAWYLGGWCHYLIGEKQKKTASSSGSASNNNGEWISQWKASGIWLQRCLKLYDMLDYEDERLGDHAKELTGNLIKEIGPIPDEESDNDDGWEDADGSDGDGDQTMDGT
ncbi:MAG: hypothetical protein M1834_001793 [Cirrosporium novae-zelandiae]|nr:MAG: hypothetical protein M1834_001793 [Cirrosporium novae-zelandiae]